MFNEIGFNPGRSLRCQKEEAQIHARSSPVRLRLERFWRRGIRHGPLRILYGPLGKSVFAPGYRHARGENRAAALRRAVGELTDGASGPIRSFQNERRAAELPRISIGNSAHAVSGPRRAVSWLKPFVMQGCATSSFNL
ncbi:hypothetical protein V2S84_10785, partial [Azotobacter chroococcum]|nr:hypothetical protein [Azotobacter chroococcum]